MVRERRRLSTKQQRSSAAAQQRFQHRGLACCHDCGSDRADALGRKPPCDGHVDAGRRVFSAASSALLSLCPLSALSLLSALRRPEGLSWCHAGPRFAHRLSGPRAWREESYTAVTRVECDLCRECARADESLGQAMVVGMASTIPWAHGTGRHTPRGPVDMMYMKHPMSRLRYLWPSSTVSSTPHPSSLLCSSGG
jgi:hypothetical protein